MSTKIEWTDRVWNPVTGCSKVSQGCKHCYAEGVANRFFAKQYPPNPDGSLRQFTDVRCHEDRLDAPLHWKKPARIFVNSMSDLFHERVPFDFIDQVFAVMALRLQHTFQILTKRPERMLAWFNREESFVSMPAADSVAGVLHDHHGWPYRSCMALTWPLPNVWLGVSVEDQKTADERIPLLLDTPATVRWVSYEPALGPVDLTALRYRLCADDAKFKPVLGCTEEYNALLGQRTHGGLGYDCAKLDWVVCGGESGPRARPCNVEWLRNTVRQCAETDTACFVKQFGAKPYDPAWHGDGTPESSAMLLNDRKGGDPAEWPADLRVRQFPGGGQ